MTTSFSNPTPFLCDFVNELRERSPSSDDIRELFLKDLDEDQYKFISAEATVLILSTQTDVESDLVGLILLSKGVDYLRINIEDIPKNIKISLQEGQKSAIIIKKNQSVNLSKIQVVFVRNFDINDVDFEFRTAFVNKYMREQWLHMFEIIKVGTLDAKWISSFGAIERLRYNKAIQLSIAKSVGLFDVPDTLITNDSDQARRFYYSYSGDVVVKCLHHHLVQIRNNEHLIYTHRFSESNLSRLDESLAFAPCIFQKRIDKKSELRITVVSEQVFAAKLNLKSKKALEEDIHLSKYDEDIDIEPFDLAPEVKNRILAMMKVFGLEYGSLDFIIDKNSKLIFLEVNPTGDWAYIEDTTGMPITEVISNLIIKEKTITSPSTVETIPSEDPHS